MRLTLTRLDERRYETVIRRPDGVRFHVAGVGHMFAIPHDLAHFAVEDALGLRRGFWGSVADGAVFPSMTYLGGRRRPDAAARSRELLRANEAELGVAELVVRIVNDALEEGHGAESDVLPSRLRERWTAPGGRARHFSDAELAAACAAWRRMLAAWRALSVGGRLELDWQGEPARVRRLTRQRRRRPSAAT